MWQILVSVLTKLAMSLVAEETLKKLIVWGMQKLVASTENTWDDELLKIAEEKWQSPTS